MLVFDCPSCQTKMQAAEEHAGKTTVCPKCGARATPPATHAIRPDPVPAPPAPPPESEPGAITTPDQARSTRRRDRDDDDDDRRDVRRRDGSSAAAGAAAGMGVGMVVLIV